MSELLDEIQRRIAEPGLFVDVEPIDTLQARAVATLFETAEPEASSKLRTIDLPAELVDAARALRDAAEDFLELGQSGTADRLGFLANCVEETSHLITEPARMLSVLMHDRDQWQTLEKQCEEMLAVTEAALSVSQASNVALAEGQSKLIGLLERVARSGEHVVKLPEIIESRLRRLGEDQASQFAGDILDAEGKAAREVLETSLNGLSDVLPEIHATLAQVTAIATDASGRLTVAQQPERPTEPPAQEQNPPPPEPQKVEWEPGVCHYCGKPTGTPTRSICDDCIPF